MGGDPVGINVTGDEIHSELRPLNVIRRNLAAHATEMGGRFPAIGGHPQNGKSCGPSGLAEIHDLLIQMRIPCQEQASHRDLLSAAMAIPRITSIRSEG